MPAGGSTQEGAGVEGDGSGRSGGGISRGGDARGASSFGRTVTKNVGKVKVTYREGTGNLQPPYEVMRLLGALSDPAQDNSAPHYALIAGLGSVALAALLLGGMLGLHALGLVLSVSHFGSVWMARWCAYMVSLCTFHLLEFFVTARYSPRSCTSESFLLTHSKAYTLAALASWAEFWFESWLLPSLKGGFGSDETTTFLGAFFGHVSSALLCAGVLMMVGGQVLRTAGMVTAGANFNHLVQDEHDGRQELVTWGVYAYLRHPAYFGWHYWSIGTQLCLGNYACAIAYTWASHRFFQSRIPHEEAALMQMFPKYEAYRKRTVIGILPYIKL